MFCTKCGKELKEGAKFCTYCGTPNKRRSNIEQQTTARLCKKCGKELKEGLKFCTYCGTPVDRVEQKTPLKEKVTVEQETLAKQSATIEQETAARKSADVTQIIPAGDGSEEKTEILFEKNVHMDSGFSNNPMTDTQRETSQTTFSPSDQNDGSSKKTWKIFLIIGICLIAVLAVILCWLFLFGGVDKLSNIFQNNGKADVVSTETESTEEADETEAVTGSEESTESAATADAYESADKQESTESTENATADAPFVEVPERSKQWQQADSSSIMIYDGTVEDYKNALNPASYALNDAHMQKQGIYFDYYFPQMLYYTVTYEYHNDSWTEADQGYGLSPILTSHAQEVYGENSTDFNLHLAKKAEIGYYGSKGSTLDCTLWEYDEKSATSSPMNYLSEMNAMYTSAFDHVEVLRAPGEDGCLYLEGTKNGFTHRILIAIEPKAKPKTMMRMWICYPTDSASDEEQLEKEYVAECLYRMCAFSPTADPWNATKFETFDEYKAGK